MAKSLIIDTAIAGHAVTLAKIVAATAESKLLGRGQGSGAGDFQEIALGTGLALTGTTLAASNNGDVVGPSGATSGNVASYNGTTGKLITDSGRVAADLVAGPASAVTARIATFNGTTGKLIQDGGQTITEAIAAAVTFARPGCVSRLSVAQSINNNTWTEAAFDDSDLFDTDGIHDPAGANPEDFTIQTAGIYLVYAHVVFASNSTGVRALRVKINGTVVYRNIQVASTNDVGNASASLLQKLAASDVLTLEVLQNSGAALNLESNASGSVDFGVYYQGASA